jgi:ABC-type transporter Mla maintaining outer membrane lipid asymmetry ATPase subunit MlaF
MDTDTTPLLELQGIECGAVKPLDLLLGAGESAMIFIEAEQVRQRLVDLLSLVSPTNHGRVMMLGYDPAQLSESERYALLRRVAVIASNGGLVSNLKAWENLLLADWYHNGGDIAAREERVLEICQQLGQKKDDAVAMMGKLPDALDLYERRVVAVARAVLLEPNVLVYDNLFGGLDRARALKLRNGARLFQEGRADRASLYLCSEDAVSKGVIADHVIHMGDSGENSIS